MLIFNPYGQTPTLGGNVAIQKARGSPSKAIPLPLGRGDDQADFFESEGILQHMVSKGSSIL